MKATLLTLLALAAATGTLAQTTGDATSAPGSSSNSSGASTPTTGTAVERPIATDPSYRLSIGDEIDIKVHNESDISTAQRIDNKGNVRIPYIDSVNLARMTVREAEQFLEKTLFEKDILQKPLVGITVRVYAVREVMVLGAVNSPGPFSFPREVDSIEIYELFSRKGGFKATGRSDEVKVTRLDENGKEQVFIVNVEDMITGRGSKGTPQSFLVYPGDRIFVRDRLF